MGPVLHGQGGDFFRGSPAAASTLGLASRRRRRGPFPDLRMALPYKVATLIYCFNHADEVLLLERAQEPNRGLWSPFGGKLHQAEGESPHACAVREAREEAGLVLTPADLHLTGVVSESGYEGQAHWLMFLFEVLPRIERVPPPDREGRFAFVPREGLGALPLPATDRDQIWPLFWTHRRGYFAAHCTCHVDGSAAWEILESRPSLPRPGFPETSAEEGDGVVAVDGLASPMIDRVSDEFFMGEALRQATRAQAADEVPIGCVVTCNGRAIARAANQVELLKDATAHAEMLAISQAQQVVGDWRLNDCTLYVTKEPCPMCAGAIVHARFQRVVFGAHDPKGGAAGGAMNLLQFPTLNHRCVVTPGVREHECRQMLRSFFQEQRAKRQPRP